MVDILEGPDVDVVCDLHQLPDEWSGRFDAFVASAVFEHLDRPWVAAREVQRVLAPRGVAYISTHQTFPLHGYPKDFFRFSTDALSLIFADAGMEIVRAWRLPKCRPTTIKREPFGSRKIDSNPSFGAFPYSFSQAEGWEPSPIRSGW